ncbi:MAG: F0F1 ATP synthase subunit A [Planctomycetia bacterium]|nr:F0F1 ATP synthase subunit A [Planctomycetia bacterium]
MPSKAFEPGHLFGHVQDSDHFEVPRVVAGKEGKITLPQPLMGDEPLWKMQTGFAPVDQIVRPLDLRLTKFMVLEMIAALIIAVVFIRLANKMADGDRPKGRLWNMLEAMLVYIRDNVARPAIGAHDADRFMPFLWTMFFFVLVCNLLGLVPWAGSATGALATTGALAILTFGTVTGSGMKKLGVVGFWKAQVPHMDLPGPLAYLLVPMIFGIEILGLFIKHFVLAVRLLANMLAGHLVLAVIVAFIAASYGSLAWWGVMPASVLGAVALSLLELFVAFLQAYIFTFLSALFIGMAVHPH